MYRNHKARALLLTAIEVLMILLCAAWVSLWLLKPTDLWTRKWRLAENSARATVFGYYGTESTCCSDSSFLHLQMHAFTDYYYYTSEVSFILFRSQFRCVHFSCYCSCYNWAGLLEFQTLQATNFQASSSGSQSI